MILRMVLFEVRYWLRQPMVYIFLFVNALLTFGATASDSVQIGGGVGNIDRLYTDGVQEALKYLFNPRIDTIFVKPKLGDSAGVFGAALL